MTRLLRLLRLATTAVLTTVLAWIAPAPAPDPVTGAPGGGLIDRLPRSTVSAVELRDLDRRWEELRSVPPLARLQDRVLEQLGLMIGNRQGWAARERGGQSPRRARLGHRDRVDRPVVRGKRASSARGAGS